MSHQLPSPGTAAARVLDAAIALLRRRGLTVGLDQISFEEAITASGASRASAYRQWPNKTDFQRSVLLRVVRDVRLEPESDADIAAMRELIIARRATLATPAGMRTLIVECLRIAAEGNFGRLAQSVTWRDHLALRATCSSLPAGELRETVAAELAKSERALTQRRAQVYAQLPLMLGYRLVPWLDPETGFTLMSETIGALMTGLIGRSVIIPVSPPRRMRALGSSENSPWTTESYAVVSTILSFIEPDPDITWDETRIETAIKRFHELEQEARRLREQPEPTSAIQA